MPNDKKGFRVPATVIPCNENFAAVDSSDVAGGVIYIESQDQLTSIPKNKCKLGMFAFVNNEGRHYKLINNKAVLDINCWEPCEIVGKEYIDDAINNAAAGNINLSEYAKKTDIPDISNLATKSEIPDVSTFETVSHAEDTYAKKTDLEALEGVVPKVINDVFEIPADSSEPLVLELKIPNGTIAVNVIAIAEVEEENSSDDGN